MARVREYGEAHPTEWAGLRFVNVPAVVIEVGFTDNLAERRAALSEIVSNPDCLRVVRAPHTAAERARVSEEILAWLLQEHPGVFVKGGHGRDRVELTLSADAHSVAEQLHDRYGDLVTLTVGTKPFPPDREPGPLEGLPRRPIPQGGPELHGVRSEIALDANTVQSGGVVRGRIVLHNESERHVTINGGQMVGSLVTPGTDEVVGVFTGAVPLFGRTVFMEPGERGELPLVVGTASDLPGPEPRLPPGEYEVVAVVHVTREEVLVPRTSLTLT